MTELSRREIIGAILLAGVAASALPARAALSLALPPQPMILRRVVERGLTGGATLTVDRAWSVQFVRQGNGIAISGSQVSARVDAPANLRRLAVIEEERSTDGMFPFLLSAEGTLLAAGKSVEDADLTKAVEEAEAIIAQQPVSSDAKAQLRHYLSQLQGAGAKLLDRMPSDLFFPMSAPLHTIEPVALPDGLMGEFELSYEAHKAPGKAWLDRAKRIVVTRIGESERRSSEEWSLASA